MRPKRLVVAISLAALCTAAGAWAALAQTVSDPLGIACVDTSGSGCYGDVVVSNGGTASMYGGASGGGTGVAVSDGQGSAVAPGDGGIAVTLGSGTATGNIAASSAGNACNSGYSRIAVSVSGQAGGCADYDCAEVALSVTGGSCGEVALSGEGSARTAPDPYCETQCGWLPGVVAVSGTGSASAGDPNSAAVSGEGPASGGEVAVSGTGPAGACGGPEPVAVQGTYPQRPTTCPGIVPPILGGGVSGPGISAG